MCNNVTVRVREMIISISIWQPKLRNKNLRRDLPGTTRKERVNSFSLPTRKLSLISGTET